MNEKYPTQKINNGFVSYTVGFAVSLVLTLVAYFMVTRSNSDSTTMIMVVITGLAITQLYVQLYVFLHLGQESGPRWKSASFAFMIIFLLILVVGSIWIMNNLNYNMMNMTDMQKDTYMESQRDKGF